jgi:tRNA threonylcarbamoyladenosine biosynthesis protein TsaB
LSPYLTIYPDCFKTLSYLFIDSTYDLYLGVLDDGLNWLSFEKIVGQKASAVLQGRVHELLNSHNISPKDLKGIINVNGPGFYTGLRLAEGFSDVFSFFGIEQFSFYSYEIPLWCGYKKGTWFTKAYRGEYFFYHWDGENSHQKLISAKELPQAIDDSQYFIHSSASLDSLSLDLIKAPIETSKLLNDYPKNIFPQVLKGLKREAFYFRAPEDEFKVNP